ncbi:MAG: hypothetical protein ACXVP0_12875 [Bacteroidia bacterium]
MKSLRAVFILLAFLPVSLFSQDDTEEETFKPKWSHSIAAGAHYIYNYYSKDEVRNKVEYSNPAPFLFYRLMRTNEKKELTCLTLNAGYRQLYGYTSNGGTGDEHHTEGTVQFLRVDFGASHLFTKGPNNGFAIGGGVYFGGLAVLASDIKSTSSSLISNASETRPANPYNELFVMHMGLNIEIQQKIFIGSNTMIVGLRAGIETPEGFDAVGPGKLLSGYIGYIFSGKLK